MVNNGEVFVHVFSIDNREDISQPHECPVNYAHECRGNVIDEFMHVRSSPNNDNNNLRKEIQLTLNFINYIHVLLREVGNSVVLIFSI